MRPATKVSAVVVLSGTIERRADEVALPTLPLAWLKMRLIRHRGERRVISIGLLPATPRQLRRYGVPIPYWCDLRAYTLFFFYHLADVGRELAETVMEVTPVLVSNHLDPTNTEIVDVVWELVCKSQLTLLDAKGTTRAYSFLDFEQGQKKRRQRFARWRQGPTGISKRQKQAATQKRVEAAPVSE